MIYTILYKLFRQDEMLGEYRARPSHLFVSLLIMAMGIRTYFIDGWGWFGSLSFILGFLLGLSIIFVMSWSKVIEYWTILNEHVVLMNKSNPDIWVALGYSKPAQRVEVIEREETGQGLFNTRISNLNISPMKMNQIANKVLGTGKLEFTEEEYGKLIPNFRQFRKDWIAQGKLVQKNKKNKKLGYVLSRKGLQVMYEFSSENMKLKERE